MEIILIIFLAPLAFISGIFFLMFVCVFIGEVIDKISKKSHKTDIENREYRKLYRYMTDERRRKSNRGNGSI